MKKALITGASGGIGLALARRLADDNHQLTLVARNGDKLRTAIASLKGSGHKMMVSDLTNERDLYVLEEHLAANRYDLLVNNAGAGIYSAFVEVALEDHLRIMKLNMDALVTLSYSFLKNASKGNALVNIASLIGLSSLPGGAVYAGSKGFVANFSESLWYEFKDKGVFVMGFNPGAADSAFHSNAGGNTGDFPKFVMSSVEDVVDELVRELQKRRKPRVVQGFKNRLMLFGFRFLSRKAAINIMGRISPGITH